MGIRIFDGIRKLPKLFNRFRPQESQPHPYPEKGGWPGLRVLPNVDNLIDVGIGHQGSEGLYRFFPTSRKFFIDPLAETKEAITAHLEHSQNKFMEFAVSDTPGTLEITVREPISQSGFKASERDNPQTSKKRNVQVQTLDRLFPSSELSGTWGLKIDVEGHEKEVLLGGQELIKYCSFVIVEVSIGGPRFENSACFEDILVYMVHRGFRVVALRVSGDGTDHCDIAFLREVVDGTQ